LTAHFSGERTLEESVAQPAEKAGFQARRTGVRRRVKELYAKTCFLIRPPPLATCGQNVCERLSIFSHPRSVNDDAARRTKSSSINNDPHSRIGWRLRKCKLPANAVKGAI
jgi:hypothetical protein